jgi:hypothetical protein
MTEQEKLRNECIWSVRNARASALFYILDIVYGLVLYY